MTSLEFRRFFRQNRPPFVLALRNTAAALTALAVAVFLQLESPHWAAMTALIVIQPTRGLLFEKSLYRLIGTAAGAVAGLLLLQQTASPLVLTIALSLWVAGCVGIGNLLHGFRSYACMMAGLTCAVIAMSGVQNPPHLASIAFGRIADVFVGILVATIVTALLTPRRTGDEPARCLQQVSGKTVAWLAQLLRQGRDGALIRSEQEILMEIAEIESRLDAVAAGSLRFKTQKRRSRRLVAALLSLLAVGRLAAESLARYPDPDHKHACGRELLAQQLDEVAARLAGAMTVNCLDKMTAVAAEAKSHFPLLGESLGEIVIALQSVLTTSGRMVTPLASPPAHELVRHRDWREALRAAIRAALALGAVGMTWSASGWTKGPMMLMAMAIMLSIFSSKEHPVAFVGQIFIGAAIGSATAVFCRIVLLPGITDPLLASAILSPFLLLGTFAMSQRKTAIPATDATLFFLFISQPGVSVAVVPDDLIFGAIAMVMGVGTAWLAYRYLVPINPAIRMHSLLGATARDMEKLAAAALTATQQRLQARIQHRIIRLVTLAKQYDGNHLRLVDDGLAVLAICQCLQRLQQRKETAPFSPADSRLIEETLLSLANLAGNPQNDLPLRESAFSADQAMTEARRDAARLFSGNELFIQGRRKAYHF